MSYKCEVCGNAVPSGTPRMLHILRRANGHIDREIPICGICADGFRSGKSLAMMQHIRGAAEQEKESKENSRNFSCLPKSLSIIEKMSPKVRVFNKPKSK